MSESSNPPIFNAPVAVKWVIGVTVLAHLLRMLLPQEIGQTLLVDLSFIPALYGGQPASILEWLLLITSPVTYLLAHIDLTHLAVNMLLLLAFGAAVGRRMGNWPFLLFYVLSGIAGAVAFGLLNIDLLAPVVGASGAVAGMVGAVGRLSLAAGAAWKDPGNPMPFQTRSAALGFIVIWLVLNFVFGVLPAGVLGSEGGGIAWETHLGGFVFGFVTIRWFDGRGRPPSPFEFNPPAHT